MVRLASMLRIQPRRTCMWSEQVAGASRQMGRIDHVRTTHDARVSIEIYLFYLVHQW